MLEKLAMFLSTYNRINKEDITYEKNLSVDLGLTSFDLVEMSCQLEEEFDVEIPMEDFMKFVTVGDIVEYLNEHCKNAG